MKIASLHGNFKIIQTIKNRDELLILGNWNELVKIFDSKRAFLVDKSTSLFGVYICKQECADFMCRIIQDIDYNEWEDFKIEEPQLFRRVHA